MRLLAQEEYGLRCLLRLAQQAGGVPRSASFIAEAEGLSPEYASRLMGLLRRGGLVHSSPGAGGGYRLARPAERVTVWEVIEALGTPLFPLDFCACHPGQRRQCARMTDCSIRALWRAADDALRDLFQRVTLADLQREEQPMTLFLTAGGSR